MQKVQKTIQSASTTRSEQSPISRCKFLKMCLIVEFFFDCQTTYNNILISHIVFQSMMRHFKTIPVVEKEALTYFIYMVKTNKSKLDRRDGIDAD